MCTPFPCGCGSSCNVCTALFSQNWAARLCVSWVGNIPGLTAGQNSDNQAFVTGINSAFNSVSIGWSSGSFVMGGITYDCRVSEISGGGSYTVHGRYFDGFNDQTASGSFTDTRLTIGAYWRPSGGSPTPCRPTFYRLVSVVSNSVRYLLIGDSGASPGGARTIVTNAGFILPSDPFPNAYSAIVASTLDCTRPNMDTMYSTTQIRINGQLCGNLVSGIGQCYVRNSTGAVVLPSC